MTLSEPAARVMSLAQHGKPDDAIALAHHVLRDAASSSPADRAAVWYAVAVAEHVRGTIPAMRTAAETSLSLATEAESAGWASNALSVRAIAHSRLGLVEPALLDLARAEAELLRSHDPALRCWAHTGLGYGYLELRLYELAQPHFEDAQLLDASPIPLVEDAVIDLMNLAELHIRWADELERAHPYQGSDDDVAAHRKEGHAWAESALARARSLGLSDFAATCGAMELVCRPRSSRPTSLDELRAAFTQDGWLNYQGGRAALGGALARSLWAEGSRREAVEVAREAAASAAAAADWQVAASAKWLLVEMEAQIGVPGAAAGRAYGELLSRVLWQQRLSTLHGAQTALQFERLHHDKEIAVRAAVEDPLTGIGNRRAFDEALRTLRADTDDATASGLLREEPVSLLMVDLDDFKQINDSYGHQVGDEVLRAVAVAVRGVARADDLVSRIGGDEFVVLARGADESVGRDLGDRITSAIDALTVGTRSGVIRLSASVGVAAAAAGDEPAVLLARADRAMYAVKEARRLTPRRPPG